MEFNDLLTLRRFVTIFNMRRRLFAFLFLIFLSVAIFASSEEETYSLTYIEDLENAPISEDVKNLFGLEEEGIAFFEALGAAYTTLPRVKLPGVEFADSEGLFPSRVVFSPSDLSSYYSALENPGGNVFSRFISNTISKITPLKKMAMESLSKLDLKKGDFVVNGTLSISGLDRISIGDMMSFNVLEKIDASAELDVLLYGSSVGKTYAIKGRIRVYGSPERKVNIDMRELYINSEKAAEKVITLVMSEA